MRNFLFAILALVATTSASLADGVAILPVKLLDTSGEPNDQTADHERRQGVVAKVLATEMPGGTLVSAETVAKGCTPETTECLLSLARDAGADHALLVVVQKSSTLIIQIFANLVETGTGNQIDSRNLSFRGDNDEAWERAGRFLADELRKGL